MSKNVKNVKNVEVKVNEEVKAVETAKGENEMVEVKEMEVVEEVEAQAQEAPTKEDKEQKYVADLNGKLRLFPRTLTIADLIGYRMKGVETWLDGQRTPSHTANKALEIIDSALNGVPCGVITLGLCTEDNTISTINGSSRIDDFIRYYTNQIGKKESNFKDMPQETQRKFLSHKLTIDWLQGTKKELIRDFKNLNNDISLTGGQKAFTNLVGSPTMALVSALKGHSVFSTMFSARQLQKEEQNNCIFLILSNILDCYNAKIDKITAELATKDIDTIDVEKLIYIFDKIESADVEISKFKFVHLVHLMYVGDCWKSKTLHHQFDVDSVDDTVIGVAISVNYTTSGTNSADMNVKRIESMAKKLYLHFTSKAVATPEPIEEVLDASSL